MREKITVKWIRMILALVFYLIVDESYIPSQDEGSDTGRGIDAADADAAGLEKDASGEGVVDSTVSEAVEGKLVSEDAEGEGVSAVDGDEQKQGDDKTRDLQLQIPEFSTLENTDDMLELERDKTLKDIKCLADNKTSGYRWENQKIVHEKLNPPLTI